MLIIYTGEDMTKREEIREDRENRQWEIRYKRKIVFALASLVLALLAFALVGIALSHL